MLSALLPILNCPHCRTGLEFQQLPTPAGGVAEFGILRCRAHTFPVLDGIPVMQRGAVGMFEHTRGTAQVAGVGVDELVRLLERGAALEALLACLAVPRLPHFARRALGWRQHVAAAQRAARALGARRFRKRVLARRDRLSARDLLEFYYRPGGALDPEMGNYFLLRFGQPRHLAALALAANIAPAAQPVLDIACGTGHLDHYLTCRPDACAVVGLDMNFYHLWIARHWIAPGASFVCANAADGLPFAHASFSATLCSDAYHYIARRAELLGEIERCAPGRTTVLTRVGNSAVLPNEGVEQTVEQYLREFPAVDARGFDESYLLSCYLRRGNPLTGPRATPGQLAERKWLSFVWNPPREPPQSARLGTGAEAWPHAVGELTLNPIYSVAGVQGDEVQLRFDFPSVHYAYENNEMLSYHPRAVTIKRAQLACLTQPRAAHELAALIGSFVVLGTPRGFLPPQPAWLSP
jgi:SAM-dependent methyltransferase/uncharacterized protein YbaR (Trm112 family)